MTIVGTYYSPPGPQSYTIDFGPLNFGEDYAKIVADAAAKSESAIKASVTNAIKGIKVDAGALTGAYEDGRYAAAADAFDWKAFENKMAADMEAAILKASKSAVKATAGKLDVTVSTGELEALAKARARQTAAAIAAESREAMKAALSRMGKADVPTMDALHTAREISGLSKGQANAVVNRAASMRADGKSKNQIRSEVETLSARNARQRGARVAYFEGKAAAAEGQEATILAAIEAGEIKGADVRWKSKRGPTTCAICRGLHGKKVSVGKSFKFGGKSYHAPPIHGSCQCEIVFTIKRR